MKICFVTNDVETRGKILIRFNQSCVQRLVHSYGNALYLFIERPIAIA